MSKTIRLPLKIKVADGFFDRFKGLMFRRKPLQNDGLWLIPCNSIHMFFMKIPIDVVMVSKEGWVVKTISNLQPWSIVPPVHFAHSTLELPVGTIEKHNIQIGDRIDFYGFQVKSR